MTVTRRVLFGLVAALAAPFGARARSVEQIGVPADEGAVALTRYVADRRDKRAAVLVLHGARGVELDPRAYQRYVDALADAGLDAYLVRYLIAADAQALDPKTSTPGSRSAYSGGRFAVWSRRVSSVVSAVLARPESTGRVGLLGFSLGGFVAAQAAADDARVEALAVLYGGLPDAMVARVKRLPPVLELHGDADRNVAPAKGAELVRLAKSLGAPAEQVTYAGRGHGFDFSGSDPMTADALARVVRFFRSNLNSM